MNRQTIKKMDKLTTKYEQKARKLKRKSHRKVGFFLIMLGLGVSWYLCYSAFIQIYTWSKNHEVIQQSPLIIQSPIVIREVKKVGVAKPTEKELEAYRASLIDANRTSTIERVYQYTRFLESRLGFDNTFESTHKYCQTIGKVNEIGYFPDGNRQFCFKNEQEQRDTFTKWMTKYLNKGYTMSEALCTYVTGTRQPMCKRSLEIGL